MTATWIKQANLFLLYALCAFPLLMPHWVSFISLALLVTGLWHNTLSKNWAFDKRFFALMSVILIPYIIFLSLSHHMAKGIDVVQVKMMLLILGIHFGFIDLRPNKKQLNTAFNVFCIAALLVALLGNLFILLKGFTHQIGFAGADFAYSYRVSIEAYTGLHPTYYCAILYIAAFIKLYQLLNNPFKPKHQNWFWIVFVIGCTVAGLLAASRATMLAYVMIVAVYILLKARKQSYRWWVIGALILVCCSLAMVPSIRARLLEINPKNMQAPSRDNDNGTNVRSGIFTCNGELLKENWLLGLGTGNVQEALNNCLSKFDTHVYQIHNYNTHNEYLNSWLTCGLLGLLVFVGTLAFSFYLAVTHNNWLHVYILVFMCLCFLTENYLERQAGVTLFALMQTLFLIQGKQNEKG